MTREHLAKIQEPFFTTKPDGHGLGLAICRSIVAQLRGQFQIESSPGSGTRVRAVLPIPREELTMASEPQGARILIVDDDPGILRAVSRILGRRHHVVCVGSGEAAVEEARRLRPDLAIVDIRLPAMNGFEVTRALKAAQPDIDAILMTGNSEEPDETLIRAIDEGAFYFIQKPFDRRVLLALVNRCLELRELREEREQFLRRVERELEEARQFQLSLLPPAQMELPGISIAARYRACTELAGDIYDYADGRRRRGGRADRRRGRPRGLGGHDDRRGQGGLPGVARRRLRADGRDRSREGRHPRFRPQPVRHALLCPGRSRSRRAAVRQRGPSRADRPQRHRRGRFCSIPPARSSPRPSSTSLASRRPMPSAPAIPCCSTPTA